MHDEEDPLDSLVPFVATAVHNLSCCEKAQPVLVAKGCVALISQLWSRLAPSFRTLCALACCHLACGEVNSARLVADGGGRVICSLTTEEQPVATSRTCAAALRNLLRVTSNQRSMSEEGAIVALVSLAKLGDALVTRHATCALRVLTYNAATREMLIEHDAISVILHDPNAANTKDTAQKDAKDAATKSKGPRASRTSMGDHQRAAAQTSSEPEVASDDATLAFSHALLCKVEAESWQNGSRAGIRPSQRHDTDERSRLLYVGSLWEREKVRGATECTWLSSVCVRWRVFLRRRGLRFRCNFFFFFFFFFLTK